MADKSNNETQDFQPTDSWLLGIVLAVTTFWLFAQTLLDVIPQIKSSLGLGNNISELAVSITALFAGIFIVVAGGLGDRFGQARVLRLGLGLNILGSLLLIVVPTQAGLLTTTLVLAGRIIQGLSAACITPSALTLINDFSLNEQARQRGVSFFSMGTFGGMGVASLIGGAVATSLGWRPIFIISILVSLAAYYLTRHTPVPKSDQQDKQQGFDWSGLLTFLIAAVGLNVYISEGSKIGWLGPIGIVIIIVTLLALLAFLIIDLKRGDQAFINLKIFKRAHFSGPVLANFLMNMTAAIIVTTLTLMQSGAGWSTFQAGLLTIGQLIAIFAAIRVGEKLLQKIGPKKPMLWGAVFDFIGLILAALTFLPEDFYIVAAFLGLTLFGMGQGVFATPAIDAAITSVPKSHAGLASGILKMGSTLGQAIGVAVSTAVVSAGSSISQHTLANWGIFSSWSQSAEPTRYGTMLGLGVLAIIAIVMIATVILTVPGDE